MASCDNDGRRGPFRAAEARPLAAANNHRPSAMGAEARRSATVACGRGRCCPSLAACTGRERKCTSSRATERAIQSRLSVCFWARQA